MTKNIGGTLAGKFMMVFVLIYVAVSGVDAENVNFGNINSDSITTITEEFDSELDIFEKIEKIYEISDSSLEKGYSENLNEKDAFRLEIKEKNYYIIVWNITKDNRVRVIFPGERQLELGINDIILADVNQDNKLDIQMELMEIREDYNSEKVVASVEIEDSATEIKDVKYIFDKKANFFIKKIIEKELIPSGSYFELFDVTVRLAKEEIYNAMELEAYIVFENFGEGPSQIDIVYSIVTEKGIEVYKGVDNKIVQTEDSVVKNFNFLELPIGKYILRTEIFYGKNQTGESEQDFEILEVPILRQIEMPLFFISTVIILFVMVWYAKRINNKISNNKIGNGNRKK